MSDPCARCKRIPASMDVETIHTPDRLPKEVDALEIIGGVGNDYALGQLRICPDCKIAYLYFRDHDSESGTGNGYTDESIQRIDAARAKEVAKENIRVLNGIIERSELALHTIRTEVTRQRRRQWLDENKRERDRLEEFLKHVD